MHHLITLLIIGIVALAGYFIPRKYNEYFQNAYHEDAISMPLAIATAIFSSLWLLFMDSDGFWYWFLLIASIVLCIISVIYVIYITSSVRAGTFEIVFAVLSQILAIAGVVILIIGTIALIMELGGKKKKKRRK